MSETNKTVLISASDFGVVPGREVEKELTALFKNLSETQGEKELYFEPGAKTVVLTVAAGTETGLPDSLRVMVRVGAVKVPGRMMTYTDTAVSLRPLAGARVSVAVFVVAPAVTVPSVSAIVEAASVVKTLSEAPAARVKLVSVVPLATLVLILTLNSIRVKAWVKINPTIFSPSSK